MSRDSAAFLVDVHLLKQTRNRKSRSAVKFRTEGRLKPKATILKMISFTTMFEAAEWESEYRNVAESQSG